jgi:hypothetical protein
MEMINEREKRRVVVVVVMVRDEGERWWRG